MLSALRRRLLLISAIEFPIVVGFLVLFALERISTLVLTLVLSSLALMAAVVTLISVYTLTKLSDEDFD